MKIGKIFIAFGCLLILSAIVLCWFNIYEAKSAEEASKTAFDAITEKVEEDAFKASDKLERETAAPVPEQIRDLKKKEVRFTKVIDRENIADAVFDFVNNK